MPEPPTTLTAVIVRTDGTVEKTQLKYDLKTMQGVVGGLIQPVYIPGATIYVNEEGLLQSLPFNPRATEFAQAVLRKGVMLVGPALILGPPDGDGRDSDVHPSVVDYYQLEN